MTDSQTDTHRHQALAFIDDAHVAMLALDALVDADYSDKRNANIAAKHQEIGRALKLAQIHSHLAIAEAIAERRPAPVDMAWGRPDAKQTVSLLDGTEIDVPLGGGYL